MLLKLVGYATLGILVAAIAVKIAIVLNLNKQVYNHRPGPCRTVEGIQYGAEDAILVERLNSAFVASGLYYMTERSLESKGQIFLYNFSQPQGQYKAIPLKLEGDFDEENFRPHGLSSVIVDGRIQLYVINHDSAFKHSVEVFVYDERETTLKHVKSIKDNKFIRPNGLLAIGKDQFFVTNDGSVQNAFLNLLEAISGIKAGSVIFYDSERSHTLIPSEVSPHGIAVDASRKHLFISSPVGRKLTVYKLAENYKSVEPISTVDLYTVPDNVHVDETGALWIGAHPVVSELIAHSASPDNLQISAPSQVLRIVFEPDFKKWTITEPYMNDGSELVASSVAVPYYGQLLIGSIYRTMLHCDIAHSSVL
uniref:Paraoxonase n=2 Tax=Parascaris univalens TaxID=6257 RepID=A0A915BPV0_PARUN